MKVTNEFSYQFNSQFKQSLHDITDKKYKYYMLTAKENTGVCVLINKLICKEYLSQCNCLTF